MPAGKSESAACVLVFDVGEFGFIQNPAQCTVFKSKVRPFCEGSGSLLFWVSSD